MGGHITFNHNYPYYEKATKWALEDWNDLVRNCMVNQYEQNYLKFDFFENGGICSTLQSFVQVDLNYVFNKEGIELVPYPAQFAIPLLPDKIKEAALRDLKYRYETVRLIEVSFSATFLA